MVIQAKFLGGVVLTASDQAVVTAGAGDTIRINSIIISNGGSAGNYTIKFYDASTATTRILANAATLLANTPILLNESIFLEANDILKASAGTTTNAEISAFGMVSPAALAPATQGHLIEDEGTLLIQRGTINFVGPSIAITDTGVKTLVTSTAITSLENDGSPKLAANLNINTKALVDNLGVKLLDFLPIADAINYPKITNSITGAPPIYGVDGIDTNIDLRFQAKGTGRIIANSPTNFSSNQTMVATEVSGTSVNCSLGNYFYKTISTATTFTFTNVPAGYYALQLELIVSGAALTSVTLPTVTYCNNSVAPTYTNAGTYIYVFWSKNSGSIWNGIGD